MCRFAADNDTHIACYAGRIHYNYGYPVHKNAREENVRAKIFEREKIRHWQNMGEKTETVKDHKTNYNAPKSSIERLIGNYPNIFEPRIVAWRIK